MHPTKDMAQRDLTYLPFIQRIFPAAMDASLYPGHLSAALDLEISNGAGQSLGGPVQRQVVFRGPGDAVAIHKKMLSRYEPVAGTTDFEWNYLCALEAKDADFWWRLSIATEIERAAGRVMPWLVLIALSDDEIQTMAREDRLAVLQRVADGRELLTVKRRYLPNLSNAWASAHVQLTGYTPPAQPGDPANEDHLHQYLDDPANAATFCSRLLCLRKLEQDQKYTVFLVNSYRITTDAIKGVDLSTINYGPTDLAWADLPDDAGAWSEEDRAAAEAPVELGVFEKFAFNTWGKGDFEKLARDLKAAPVDPSLVGTRAVDASTMDPTNALGPLYFKREGALQVPGYDDPGGPRPTYANESQPLPLTPELNDSLNEALDSSLGDALPAGAASPAPDENEDPLVTFPVYGRFQRRPESGIQQPADGAWPSPVPWIHELNLDYRYRVAAGFGKRVVQRNQETFMRDIWRQLGDIRAANERLRKAKSAVKVGTRLEQKHLRPLGDERFTLITSPFQTHVTTGDAGASRSFRKALRESGIVPGVVTETFRRHAHQRIGINNTDIFAPWRIARRNSNPFRRFICGLNLVLMALPAALYNRFNTSAVARALLRPVLGIFDWFGRAISCNRPRLPRGPETIGKRAEAAGHQLPGLGFDVLEPKPQIIPVTPYDISNDYRPRFDLKKVQYDKVSAGITFRDGRTVSPEFEPIVVCPELLHPMNRELQAISLDYFVPGVEFLKNNGATLMEENRRFIEAFVAGINHELIREALYQGVPLDLSCSPARRFWDSVTAGMPPAHVKPIADWTSCLGGNAADDISANLVLVIKGDLVRRYPDVIVYAIRISDRVPDTDPNGQPIERFKFWSEYTNDPMPGGQPPIDPVFRAVAGDPQKPDILFFGFDFGEDQVRGDARDGEYYICLQENTDLTRYALDIDSDGGVAWPDVTRDAAGYITGFDAAPWSNGAANPSAATVAALLYQRPFRAVIHISKLIEPEGQVGQ